MPAIIVHGGAGNWQAPQLSAARSALPSIIEEGWKLLSSGASAVEAAVKAVQLLEDSTCFNAGHGSVANSEGLPELDAIVTCGQQRNFGAVAGVSRVANPVLLAETIRTNCPHNFLIADGAERFARVHGLRLCVPAELLAKDAPDSNTPSSIGDTVGACVLDSSGNLASALSTGGTRNKLKGRVGDVPLYGAGTFSDNALGAVAATGQGERISRSLLAYSVALQLQASSSPTACCQSGINKLEAICCKSEVGLIALTPDGEVGWHFTTHFMPGGWVSSHSHTPQLFGV